MPQGEQEIIAAAVFFYLANESGDRDKFFATVLLSAGFFAFFGLGIYHTLELMGMWPWQWP